VNSVMNFNEHSRFHKMRDFFFGGGGLDENLVPFHIMTLLNEVRCEILFVNEQY